MGEILLLLCDASRRPSAQLSALLASLSLHEFAGCRCQNMASKMNTWGIEGCRANREEIKAHLETEAAKHSDKIDWEAVRLAMVESGLAERINPADVFGSLVDIAIDQAELAAKAL